MSARYWQFNVGPAVVMSRATFDELEQRELSAFASGRADGVKGAVEGGAGPAFRVLRESLGLTVEDLAGRAGVDSAFLGRVEASEVVPTPEWSKLVTQAVVRVLIHRA